MLKILIGILLSFIIISGIGVSYSQSDSIPTWIKGVAGYWVEDKITDLEFIEALEFLIESGIIKVADPRVLELEKENSELRQKIELFEYKDQEVVVTPVVVTPVVVTPVVVTPVVVTPVVVTTVAGSGSPGCEEVEGCFHSKYCNC